MGKKLVLDELTSENVSELTEEDVFNILTKDISQLPKEKRSKYASLINSAFEVRTIGVSNRTLKGDLAMFGFKFFSGSKESKLITGVKRRMPIN